MRERIPAKTSSSTFLRAQQDQRTKEEQSQHAQQSQPSQRDQAAALPGKVTTSIATPGRDEPRALRGHSLSRLSILRPDGPTQATERPSLAGTPGNHVVQRAPVPQPAPAPTSTTLHQVARQASQLPAGPLPHATRIQRSFGPYDISSIQAHQGKEATASARVMQARAFTTDQHVVFADAPDVYTAAHEATHVLQQQRGVQLEQGIGEKHDHYEQQANAVAARVVAGQSAEDLLPSIAQKGEMHSHTKQNEKRLAIQRMPEPDKEHTSDQKGERWKDDAYDPPLVLLLISSPSQENPLGTLLFRLEKGTLTDYVVAQNIYLDHASGLPLEGLKAKSASMESKPFAPELPEKAASTSESALLKQEQTESMEKPKKRSKRKKFQKPASTSESALLKQEQKKEVEEEENSEFIEEDVSQEKKGKKARNKAPAKDKFALNVIRFKKLIAQDEFHTFIQQDKKTDIKIDKRRLKGNVTQGETSLWAEVNGVYHNVDDPEDNLFRTFDGWSKVNKDTQFRVVIDITTSLANNPSPEKLLVTLAHEYAIHAVEFKKFIEFVRQSDNLYSEIALYFFRHSDLTGGHLNAGEHHTRHGTSSSVVETESEGTGTRRSAQKKQKTASVKVKSGSETFNKIIERLLENSGEDEREKIIEYAEHDVKKAGKEEANDTTSARGVSIKDLHTGKGSPDRLLQFIALYANEKKRTESGIKAGASVLATLNAYDPQILEQLLVSYLRYVEAAQGNVLKLTPESLMKTLKTVEKDSEVQAEKDAQPVTLLPPMPRTIQEALAEYLALGGHEYGTEQTGQIASEAAAMLDNPAELHTVVTYVAYRATFALFSRNKVQASLWLSFQAYLERLGKTQPAEKAAPEQQESGMEMTSQQPAASLAPVLNTIFLDTARRKKGYEQNLTPK